MKYLLQVMIDSKNFDLNWYAADFVVQVGKFTRSDLAVLTRLGLSVETTSSYEAVKESIIAG